MILSGYKDCWRQPFLFDEPLRGHGHVRTVIGDLCERLTAAWFNGKRFKTDSRAEYCPDVKSGSMYFECKAAGRSRTTFVYKGRLEKDELFAANNDLWYVIWHHRAETKFCETVESLILTVLESLQYLVVAPFKVVNNLCKSLKVERLNSAYGRHGKDTYYGSGYRIPLKLLAEWVV